MGIRIYGVSDDLTVIDGDVHEEGGATSTVTVGTVTGGVVVGMRYKGPAPVWSATVRQIDEGVPIPWPVTISCAPASGLPDPRSYSAMVTIDCPPGTPVRIGKKLLNPPTRERG